MESGSTFGLCARAVYNFLPNEHPKEIPFLLMFGGDHIVPLNYRSTPTFRYIVTDENILSIEALKTCTDLIQLIHSWLEKGKISLHLTVN